jgi:hypothetical protein
MAIYGFTTGSTTKYEGYMKDLDDISTSAIMVVYAADI